MIKTIDDENSTAIKIENIKLSAMLVTSVILCC